MTESGLRAAARRCLLGCGLVCALGGAFAAAAPAATQFRQAGRWIVYPDGRVFEPHGLDIFMNHLPYYPPPLGADDARLMAREGFTAVRLAFEPYELEPTPGHFDLTNVDRSRKLTSYLGRYGIGTYMSLMQDKYSTDCPWAPYGGDGFPQWMLPVQCSQIWSYFFGDAGAWLRQQVAKMWGMVASRFKDEPSLIGYDLFNEPGTFPDQPLEPVKDLMRSTLAAVRAVDSSHTDFVEPPIGYDVVSDHWLDASAMSQVPLPGAGFTSHLYCTGGTPEGVCAWSAKHEIDALAQVAMLRRSPYWLGEFGWSDPTSTQTAIVNAANRRFLPWTYQEYEVNDTAPQHPSPGNILVNEWQPASEANANQQKLNALVVPYPMATAGTPLHWSFNGSTDRVRFVYSTARVSGGRFGPEGATVIFIPQRKYVHGYAVRAHGASVESAAGSPWLELRALPGARRVVVKIRPTAGGRTLTPLQANECGYDLGPCG